MRRECTFQSKESGNVVFPGLNLDHKVTIGAVGC